MSLLNRAMIAVSESLAETMSTEERLKHGMDNIALHEFISAFINLLMYRTDRRGGEYMMQAIQSFEYLGRTSTHGWDLNEAFHDNRSRFNRIIGALIDETSSRDAIIFAQYIPLYMTLVYSLNRIPNVPGKLVESYKVIFETLAVELESCVKSDFSFDHVNNAYEVARRDAESEEDRFYIDFAIQTLVQIQAIIQNPPSIKTWGY